MIKGKASHTWKAIAWSSSLVQKGSKRCVLNGKKVRSWLDAWLERMPINELILHPLNAKITNIKVGDYWFED